MFQDQGIFLSWNRKSGSNGRPGGVRRGGGNLLERLELALFSYEHETRASLSLLSRRW